ncbi:hypothetical protein HDU93_002397, partial [Gonapodya sp. JEL0774]
MRSKKTDREAVAAARYEHNVSIACALAVASYKEEREQLAAQLAATTALLEATTNAKVAAKDRKIVRKERELERKDQKLRQQELMIARLVEKINGLINTAPAPKNVDLEFVKLRLGELTVPMFKTKLASLGRKVSGTKYVLIEIMDPNYTELHLSASPNDPKNETGKKT